LIALSRLAMASVDDPLEQLRVALREAAADGFAGVMGEGLGLRMRSAADRLLAGGVGPQQAELAHFRGGLERFEERGRQDRCRVVGHGLRLSVAIAADRAVAA